MTEERSSDEATRELFDFAAELMEAGASNSEIAAKLVGRGLDEEMASAVVEKLSSARAEAVTRNAQRLAVSLREAGVDDSDIVSRLQEDGLDEKTASSIVGSAAPAFGKGYGQNSGANLNNS